MTRRLLALAVALGAAAAAAGCGGGGEPDPGDAPGSAPAPDSVDAAPVGARVEGPADSAAPDARPSADTVAESGPRELPGTWSTETRARDGSRPMAELVSARAAGHAGYDRLVLEFRDRIPGYTIGYVAADLHQCGSGRPVDTSAPHALVVDLSPAAAHDERGTAMETRTLAPGLPVMRAARVICDFEGVVEWVVEAERRVPMRVLTLEDPARLVIDLRADGDGG